MKALLFAKKHKQQLTEEQIEYWIKGVTDRSIPDYQTTALLMAIRLNKMNIKERAFLCRAMINSGDQCKFEGLKGFIVDKHSSGGIGDKTSLILAPLLAEVGSDPERPIKVPMVSGRGLGHTGGTLDKLESIPGFDIAVSMDDMRKSLESHNFFMGGQTGNFCPADKIIYSLRDVTETVDDISLITASILCKKIAERLNGLTQDIKVGTGAFMKTYEEAEELAKSICFVANEMKVNTNCMITRMNFPIGEMIGNANETWECFQAINPKAKHH